MYCSNLFRAVLFSLLFIQLNGATTPEMKMGRPGSEGYLIIQRILQENKIPMSALNDPDFEELIYWKMQANQHHGYDGVMADIKLAYDLPHLWDHRVVRKYFKSLGVVDTSKLSPKEKLRAELKQKFGTDCPARVEAWEGYKSLVEKYNANFANNNIDLLLTPETIAHVCHSSLTDNGKLVGGHFICFGHGCEHGRSTIDIGNGGQVLSDIVFYEAPGIEATKVTKERTTYFKPGRKVEEVLEEIFKTLIANDPSFVKKSANKIDIQTNDGEYITILLQQDGKTIATFYPSMKNFDKSQVKVEPKADTKYVTISLVSQDKISYQTTSERYARIARAAEENGVSINTIIDSCVDMVLQ